MTECVDADGWAAHTMAVVNAAYARGRAMNSSLRLAIALLVTVLEWQQSGSASKFHNDPANGAYVMFRVGSIDLRVCASAGPSP